MSKESIAEKVRERIVQEYGVPRFLEDDVVLATIGDSLDKIQLNMSLEDEFNILIEDDEMEKLITVGDVVEIVYNKVMN